MSWVKKVPPPHECNPPQVLTNESIGLGSIWECDSCHIQWILSRGWFKSYWWRQLPVK